jgi:hypothetical protein
VAEDTTTSTTTKKDKPATGSGAGQEIFLGLLWLGTGAYATHMEITKGGAGPTGVLGNAAAALPGLIVGTLVASLGICAAVASRYEDAGRRLLVGLGVGVLFGAVAGAGIRFAYGSEPSINVLAVVVGVAGVVGGIAAALPGEVIDAAMWGATWVFFAGVIFGVWQANATKMLGGGPDASQSAQDAANARFTWAQTILTGVIGGVYAYRSLRNGKPRWIWFAVAGAVPGLALLVAEGLTRVGGASVVTFVHGLSSGDAALVQVTDSARLRYAVIVLAVGAVVAAVGGVRALARSDD